MTEQPVYFSEPNQSMIMASQQAQASFKYFWRELSWEYRRIIPALALSAIKIAFDNRNNDNDGPEFEHMWAGDVNFDGDTVSGTLLNTPQWVTSVQAEDTVSVPFAYVSDWMYVLSDKVYGAYTVNVMRSHMSAEEREHHDDAWGFNFGDPKTIDMIAYDRSPDIELDRQEHPMSENMAAKIDEALTQSPTAVTQQDADGWTMLHHEALAGNLAPVRILLAHGADPMVRNGNGDTASDLAQKMGWPNIVEILASA